MRAGKGRFVLWLTLGWVPSATAHEPWPTKGWPVAEPRVVGLDPKVLDALDAGLAAGKYGNVDSMLVSSISSFGTAPGTAGYSSIRNG
jgi:hypothetical protein